MTRRRVLVSGLRSCALLIAAGPAGVRGTASSPSEQAATGMVYVVLWFDTEDYILPQSDDAAKRIAGMLTAMGVRATFKLVGEKGRTVRRPLEPVFPHRSRRGLRAANPWPNP
jgi:hypothetical protein